MAINSFLSSLENNIKIVLKPFYLLIIGLFTATILYPLRVMMIVDDAQTHLNLAAWVLQLPIPELMGGIIAIGILWHFILKK